MNIQKLLDKYKIKLDHKMILDMWNESSKSKYNLDYLTNILEYINKDYSEFKIDEKTKEKLELVSLFNNVLSDKEKCCEFLINSCLDKENQDIKDVVLVINDSKQYEDLDQLDSILFNKYSSKLSSIFSKYIKSI
jgi:hypothetical protein